MRPINFSGAAAAACQIGIAFEKMCRPPDFSGTVDGRARCARVNATENPHAMSIPLLLRIGLFLFVHAGIVAGVLAFP